MKKLFLNKTIRNMFHSIAGFWLGYEICNQTGLFDSSYYIGFDRILVTICLSIFTTALGGLYEFLINCINPERKGSLKDAITVGIGGAVAGLSTMLLTYNPDATLVLNIILLPLVLVDIIYAFKTRK